MTQDLGASADAGRATLATPQAPSGLGQSESIPSAEFATKWPAARLKGPTVPAELALEFIRRTDSSLVGEVCCNNRQFERELSRLLGLPHFLDQTEDWATRHSRAEAFKAAFGHVALEHLSSQWVACSWIGGPNGPVSPSGRVELAKNFGKWPSAEKVESDLSLIAPAFPWLTFDLSVWGHREEECDGLPSHTWHLEGGQWQRCEPTPLPVSAPDVMSTFLIGLNNPMREHAWTVAQIERMWGTEIATARAAAQAIEARQGQDPKGLDPKGESAVAESDAP